MTFLLSMALFVGCASTRNCDDGCDVPCCSDVCTSGPCHVEPHGEPVPVEEPADVPATEKDEKPADATEAEKPTKPVDVPKPE